MKRGLAALSIFAALAGAASARAGSTTEVVVTLDAPPLAQAIAGSRVLTPATKARRLALTSPTSITYASGLARARRALEARVLEEIPTARVRWRYTIVLNGFAVVVPSDRLGQLARIRGVARVYPSVSYRRSLDRSPSQIGAPFLWGPGLSTAGNGLKIGIIDDGLDQTHPFFDPSGYAMPPGFPKGQTAFTSAKVVVARAFPPPSPQWKYADRPFDPEQSEHATHVAGIAAGNNGTLALGRFSLSGIAPRAYLGNYKVLTIPTDADVGLDGNAPEIAKGIESAVADGMDVINLSLGEPEIEPSRDVVVRAIDGAASAGVVPVIAAGNDFDDFGRGSVSSPGSAARAITVGAVTTSRSGTPNVIAGFSSSGPTPISLQLKPEVSAPGVSILSSVPARAGTWAVFSGTSMAAPHVAGAAALLRQRHPRWTVAQIKSALALTGGAVSGGSAEAPVTREGGGVVDLTAANDPKVFAAPVAVSFGLTRGRGSIARTVSLTDAGGGAGTWSVSVVGRSGNTQAVSAPATVTVPGDLRLLTRARLAAGEHTGFVVLRRNGVNRRIPYLIVVARPRLGRPARALARTGQYVGDARRGRARVSAYRYPEEMPGGVPRLAGPEQVFRVRLRRTVANFGVAVLGRAGGVQVHPRVVFAGNENRLVGYPGLPLNLNPYLVSFLRRQPVVGAIRPAAGSYDVVFDTPSRARAGRFTFRFWLNDTTPPAVGVPARAAGGMLAVRATDRGSGVDPTSLRVSIDGSAATVTYSRRSGRANVRVGGLASGRHALVFQVSDFQEAKNMEDVLPILPNTRIVRTTFVVP